MLETIDFFSLFVLIRMMQKKITMALIQGMAAVRLCPMYFCSFSAFCFSFCPCPFKLQCCLLRSHPAQRGSGKEAVSTRKVVLGWRPGLGLAADSYLPAVPGAGRWFHESIFSSDLFCCVGSFGCWLSCVVVPITLGGTCIQVLLVLLWPRDASDLNFCPIAMAIWPRLCPWLSTSFSAHPYLF